MSSNDSFADLAAVAEEDGSSGRSRPPSSTIGTSAPTIGTSTIPSRASPEVARPPPKHAAVVVDVTGDDTEGKAVGQEQESSGGLVRKKEALLDFAHQKNQEKNDITLSLTKHPSIVRAESCISASVYFSSKAGEKT